MSNIQDLDAESVINGIRISYLAISKIYSLRKHRILTYQNLNDFDCLLALILSTLIRFPIHYSYLKDLTGLAVADFNVRRPAMVKEIIIIVNAGRPKVNTSIDL